MNYSQLDSGNALYLQITHHKEYLNQINALLSSDTFNKDYLLVYDETFKFILPNKLAKDALLNLKTLYTAKLEKLEQDFTSV